MHSISDPSRVRFTGPLAPFAAQLRADLVALGYASTSASTQLQLAAHLSRWLQVRRLGLGDLSGPVLAEFLVDRRRDYSHHYSIQALGPTLGYLRRVGAAPATDQSAPVGPAEELLARFRRYLLLERSVTVPVAEAYVRWVRPFVDAVAATDPQLTLEQVDAAQVARFLTGHLPGLTRKTAQMTACSLRSFLRFLHAEGATAVELSTAVPVFAFWRLSGLPQPLTPAQVQALVGACDPCSPVGGRDLAVIACLLRLGLRCAEVAALRLEDVDWASGTLVVRGKGNRIDRLPLPVDVGQQLVTYLRGGRPTTTARALFVSARAPFQALARTSVSCIVGRAAARAGLGVVHAHRLRHTAASTTLNAGATLEQVAQLLRHASPSTTAVYAKTDLSRLATLARPWPCTPSTGPERDRS
ncbi:MAG: site-specific integrase [Actinomycetota bacterium]|nr:site-specific integrase [Actinomycetota bacterium]